MRWRTAAFLAWTGAVVLSLWGFLYHVVKASLEHGYSSQSVLVPLLTAYLIWSDRKRIFSRPRSSIAVGAVVAAAGCLAACAGVLSGGSAQVLALIIVQLSGVFLMIAGGFIAAYGGAAFRSAIFPFALLLLMLPVPAAAIDKVITLLQVGSAVLSYHLFSMLGVPVYREGVILRLPGVAIEVAKECSGINSSIALLLTALLAAWETLRTTSRRVVLVLITIPLSLIKNAVRIVTLTMLALYVDPGFLTGRLHHEGGFVFFIIALLLVYPAWWYLQRSEQKSKATAPVVPHPVPAQAVSAGR